MFLKSAVIAKDNEYNFKELGKFCHIGLLFPRKKALEKQHKFFNFPSIDSLTSTLLKKKYSVYQSPQKLFKIIIIIIKKKLLRRLIDKKLHLR